MMKYVKVFLLVCDGFYVHAQNCDCGKEFLFVKNYIEINYAGFNDKVTTTNKKQYDHFSKTTLSQTKGYHKPAYCLSAIRNYLDFFKDRHTRATFKPTQITEKDTATITQLINEAGKITLTAEMLDKLKNKAPNDLEGIYIHNTGNYKIALFKNKNEFHDYVGVIIESKIKWWSPNQVKIELRADTGNWYNVVLYNYFHSPMVDYYKIVNGVFLPSEYYKESKGKPERKGSYQPFEKEENSGNVVFVKNLSDSCNYIRIKSFNPSFSEKIDSVVKANEAAFRSLPYLVIDVRNNGGGGDGSYYPLLPFIYTNPVESPGNEFLATPANIALYEKTMDKKDPYDSARLKHMQNGPGKMVEYASHYTRTFPTVYTYPKKVAVIINGGCASATEQFLLEAKESKKVTICGQPSAGILDYSNVLYTETPCMNFVIGYSSTRSRRVPAKAIDNIGIQPSLQLTFDKDWPEKVLKTLHTETPK